MWTLLTVMLLSSGPGEPLPLPPPPIEDEVPLWTEIAVDDCKEKLRMSGLGPKNFSFRTRSTVKRTWNYRTKKPIFCHVPQGLIMHRGHTGMRYYGYTYLSCAMGLALTRMEEILQEEARRIFERPATENPVSALSHLGTYNCRTLRKTPTQSQHSFGNAIDLAGFAIRGYGIVEVKKHWNPRRRSQRKASEFLRAVSRRLSEEEVFTNVLDPDSDHGHWNHIHVDLAPTSDGEPSNALDRTKALPFSIPLTFTRDTRQGLQTEVPPNDAGEKTCATSVSAP